jgi:stage II sporulation protein E
MNVGGEDNFAALDICAIDLSAGNCDFIKLGSPEAYIKNKKNTEVVASNTLPIGILEDLSPSVTTKPVQSGDIVVLVSDGVSESFRDSGRLKEFIFTEDTNNPQQLAEAVLRRALKLNGGEAKDDMTVLTMRVYAIA